MIPPSFIQELLSRTDVVTVVGRHVELKKAGINYKGLCPFHGEKSPSFVVSPSRQTYHCFGCGVHGDALRFLIEHHGMGFIDAIKDLAQEAGLQVPEVETSPAEKEKASRLRERQLSLTEILDKAATHYKKALRAHPPAVDYLKGRGLTGEIAQRFGLGYAPDSWRSLASVFPHYDDALLVEAGMVITVGDDPAHEKRYDRFRDRIMFPIRNIKGELIGFGGRVLGQGEPKYLNSPETPLFVKGRELYGLYEGRTALRDKGYVLVTEGYMDVVALAQWGFANTVATLGTACTAEHVHKLLRFTDQVVFSFDGDAAGRRAAGRALEAALPHATDTRSFRFLFLPKEHDPDSYVRAYGTEAFEACVRAAVPLSKQLLEHCAADCDLNTAEGRSRLLAQAKPLWAMLPEESLRLQLLAEFSRLGGIATHDLLGLWGHKPKRRAAETLTSDRLADSIETGPANDARPRGKRDFWERRSARKGLGDPSSPHPVGNRQAPKKPEDRVVQMLFGEPRWWDELPAHEHELLHALAPPHGAAIAWLERDLAEHGARPWAVLHQAMQADEELDDSIRALADGDADPGATIADFRRAVDVLLERDLAQQMKGLLSQSPIGSESLARYRELDRLWREVKQRQLLSNASE